VPEDPQGRWQDYVYYSLPAAEKNGLKGISKLPYSMKVLLETCCAMKTTARQEGRHSGSCEVAEEARART